VTPRPQLLALLALLGCATTSTPSPAEAYARALDAGQLETAYALTTPAYRAQVTEEQFRVRFADPAARAARAAAVRDGMGALARAAPELFGPPAAERPVEVVLRFATAVRAGHFDQARNCLGAALRERYTAELLERDYRSLPSAAARLERALVAVEGLPVVDGEAVRFPVSGGGAVVVRREPDGWKLEALE
jgi:hypothetical protein